MDCSSLRFGSLKWPVFSVYSSHTKKPCWGKQAPVLPAHLQSFRCDSFETCVRPKCRKVTLEMPFQLSLLSQLLPPAKLPQPLQPHFSLLFSAASGPLLPLSAGHSGDREHLKFYEEEIRRPRPVDLHCIYNEFLWAHKHQRCFGFAAADRSPLQWPILHSRSGLVGRGMICPAWSNSLHNAKATNMMFTLYQNSRVKGKAIYYEWNKHKAAQTANSRGTRAR